MIAWHEGLMKKARRAIAQIPHHHIRCLGQMLGQLYFLIDVPHRRIVRRNLHFAYPEWSQAQIKAVSSKIFGNIGITLIEILQFSCFKCADFIEQFEVQGEGYFWQALENPNGAIMISAHLGNWEALPHVIACRSGHTVTSVARRLDSSLLNRWVLDYRTRFGNGILFKKEALSGMRKTLRSGKILGLLIDQTTKKKEGVEVLFFGRKVMATPAAALMALRCRASVLLGYCIRDAQGRLIAVAEKPLELVRSGDMREDIVTNTQLMTTAIENAIRRHCDQWFWVHKRWKRHYPELYPEYRRRMRRKRKKMAKQAKRQR
jgi:KDO2-lipid IV(A) lauroyltransferase